MKDSDADEGLCMLLGLSLEDMPNADCGEQNNFHHNLKQKSLTKIKKKGTHQQTVHIKQALDPSLYTIESKEDDAFIFENAHSIDKHSGKVLKAPVQIVNLSKIGKGNALVATRNICKGEVIYTEKALDAVQVIESKSNLQSVPRGCQYCFRSLETASTFQKTLSNLTHSPDASLDEISSLPHACLWPIEDYIASPLGKNQGSSTFPASILVCSTCKTYFCSTSCYRSYRKKVGCCCNMKKLSNELASFKTENMLTPPLQLAVRLFISHIHQHRASKIKPKSINSVKHILFNFCGDYEDVDALEIGECLTEVTSNKTKYSLERIYNQIICSNHVTELEKKDFNINIFHKLAAISYRNCIGLRTQSPFKPYYSSLIRNLGRNSESHKKALLELSLMLGSNEGLSRTMDTLVEEACAINIAGLFALTAKINHSCDPSAEVQAQNFVDNHIDVLAKRDIYKGEEITISYINLHRMEGKRATDSSRRQRELQSRYLFLCDCPRCNCLHESPL